MVYYVLSVLLLICFIKEMRRSFRQIDDEYNHRCINGVGNSLVDRR